ncbi:145_t:CDS:2 [Entrophospora sp. SA101]|nr:145_t:CDS:2 [Entrophospora sp. SA101]
MASVNSDVVCKDDCDNAHHSNVDWLNNKDHRNWISHHKLQNLRDNLDMKIGILEIDKLEELQNTNFNLDTSSCEPRFATVIITVADYILFSLPKSSIKLIDGDFLGSIIVADQTAFSNFISNNDLAKQILELLDFGKLMVAVLDLKINMVR